MENLTIYLIYIASFAVIALTSKQIGHYFKQLNLPLINRFLLFGSIIGPFLLNLISVGIISNLKFIDESIFARSMGSHILWVGLPMGFISLGIGYWGWITNAVYRHPPQSMFGTRALPPFELAVSLGLSAVIFMTVEIEKCFKRTYSKV
ncbi:MAG: hypothetical protein N2C13_05875 [Chloroflexota bacterium]